MSEKTPPFPGSVADRRIHAGGRVRRRRGGHRGRVWVTLALVAGVLTACRKPPQEPLRVGLVVWPPFDMAYLARELGYYDGAGIRLIDYALQLQQDDPQIILAIDVSLGGDAIVAALHVLSLEELKGRTVGYEAGALGAYVLTWALPQAGLGLDDINPHYVDIIDQEQTFRDGKVDAVVTYEPTVTRLVEDGATVLFDSSQIPGEIVDVLLTSSETLEQTREQLQRLVDGWFAAIRYLQANPEDAARHVAGREQMTPKQFLGSFEKLKLMALDANRDYLTGSQSSAHRALRRHRDVMVEEGFLDQPLDTTIMIAESLALSAPDG